MHFLPLTRSGVVYGSHPRQCLDVFRPATECAAAAILGYFHGGGFIRGGKQNRAHVGAWGA
jgi:acetyl esterase/lipase